MNTYSLAELTARDDRRDHIASMFLRGEWKGAASRRELADAWGMRRGELFELENQAIGACRLAAKEDWPQRVAAAMAELDAVKAAAWESRQVIFRKGQDPEVVLQPELKVIIDATKLQLQVYGALGQPAKAQQKPEGDDLDRMPVAEQRALLMNALAELDSKEARH